MEPLYKGKEDKSVKKKKKKALTDKEILTKLKSIRDDALNWWTYCVETQTTSGSNTSAEMFKKAVDELERIEQRSKSAKIQGKIELVFSKPDNEFMDEDFDYEE